MSRSAKAKAIRSHQRCSHFDSLGWTAISETLYRKVVDGSMLYYDVERMRIEWRGIVKFGVEPQDIDHFISNRVQHAGA